MLVNLLNFNRLGLVDFLSSISEPAHNAQKLMRWVHYHQTADFSKMTNLSLRLQTKLQSQATVSSPKLLSETLSEDGTYKWLLGFQDNNAIETVFIPELKRGTLCISSQVGCSLNCSFCATAQAGFNRNLTTAEIIGQLWWAKERLKTLAGSDERRITNVVLMGMGEPLLNYKAVIAAIDIMLDDSAYGLSKYRVTLSTSGLVPAIQRLRQDSTVSLAISLHAPNNALRNQLVPINKKYPLEVLIPVCREYYSPQAKQQILFEYVMLAGVNDHLDQARELVDLLKDIRCKVNLIPFNPYPGAIFECSDPQTIKVFQDYLTTNSIPTWVRRTRGHDIKAACGQLAGQIKNLVSNRGNSKH